MVKSSRSRGDLYISRLLQCGVNLSSLKKNIRSSVPKKYKVKELMMDEGDIEFVSKYDISPHFASELEDFKKCLPLLGNTYYFPSLPVVGREMRDENTFDDDSCYAYKDDLFSMSTISYDSLFKKDVEYPNDIPEKTIDDDNFDVVSFLSSDTRPYLVRNDSRGTRSPVGGLKDKKWVMICCFHCPIFSYDRYSLICKAVSDACSDLYSKYGASFEMVVVLYMRKDYEGSETAFKHMLSGFPSSCLVVPFWDSHSRLSICRSLGSSSLYAHGLLLRADKGKVIWKDQRLLNLTNYGFDAFPFTDKVFELISHQDENLSWKSYSLETLFSCSSSLVLPKIPGSSHSCRSTSIEQLQKKLVIVYVCQAGVGIPILHELYEVCKAIHMKFKIVVVYAPFNTKTWDAEVFQLQINHVLEKRGISGWILPYESWVSRRLLRICISVHPCYDKLIIVNKGVVDPHGNDFLRKFERLVKQDVSIQLKKMCYLPMCGLKHHGIWEGNSDYYSLL